MAKMEGLAHVGLFTGDIERSVKFYTEILDFEVTERTQFGTTKAAFIKNGNLVIEILEPEQKPERADGWFDHIAFDVEGIDEIKERLVKKGVVFEQKEAGFAPHAFEKGLKYIFFRGPDGEYLELNEIL